MSDVIQFYYNPMSRARMVHWALEEVGEPYNIHLVDFEKKEEKAAEYLALNPMGKVPMIVHKGVVVTETAAILTYLGDAFPQKKLAPAINDPGRGTYLRWLFFVAGCYEAAVIEKNFPRAKPANPMMLGFGSYEDVLNTIEKALQPGPNLLGSAFTMADLYLAAQLGWSLQFKTIEARPVFLTYVERAAQRPANRRANEKANEIIAKMKKQ